MGDGVLFAMCFAEAGIKIAESLGVEAHRPEGYSTHGNRMEPGCVVDNFNVF